MHLALPTRKSSNPPAFTARTSRFPTIRRSRVQVIMICALAIGAILFIFSQILGGAEGIPSGTPPVVIVTVLEPGRFSKQYLDNVKENRIEYAKKHGYAAFTPSMSDYNLKGAPPSWARVPAMRHAITKFPHTTYFWYLDHSALIMNPELSIENHIMNPKRLEGLMQKDKPIVPPDSVIRTFSHIKGQNVDIVLTQDKEGLAGGSFIVRRGEWAKFFLDTWFDPLYRSYNFQKAETHALEHIVQWHPTILSKLVIVPERIMSSRGHRQGSEDTGSYQDGDFVIRFVGCDLAGRDCAKESEPFSSQWKKIFQSGR